MTAPTPRPPSQREVLETYARSKRLCLYGMDAYRELVAKGYPEKRILFVIHRLNDLGLMDCGVTERTGWVTDEGLAWLAGSH